MSVGLSSPPSHGSTIRGPIVIEVKRPIIVTIDGPAGTGKSSVARALAHRLGLDFLDTGAMYRAAAAIVIDRGVDRLDAEAVVREVSGADLHFDWSADPPRILAWGRPMERRIRASDVEEIVSPLAGIGALRRHLVAKQRIIAQQHPKLVTEGRDQGSVVFPDALVKFYLDAAPQVRARRRAEQLRASGRQLDEAALLAEIIERDRSDSARPDGPLTVPEGAVWVDTSDLSFEQVVERLEQGVRARLAAP